MQGSRLECSNFVAVGKGVEMELVVIGKWTEVIRKVRRKEPERAKEARREGQKQTRRIAKGKRLKCAQMCHWWPFT